MQPTNRGIVPFQASLSTQYEHAPTPLTNLLNSYVPPLLPISDTDLSTYTIQKNPPSNISVSPLKKLHYPITDNFFEEFMNYFPSIQDITQKKIIKETLETIPDPSRNEKMSWICMNLFDRRNCYDQIIRVLNLSFPTDNSFYTNLDLLAIPKDMCESLLKPKCMISIGCEPLPQKTREEFEPYNRISSIRPGPQSDAKIMQSFQNLKKCTQSQQNPNPHLKAFEQRLQEMSKLTFTNIVSHADEINEHTVQLIESLCKAYTRKISINKINEAALLTKKLIRKECFSLYPVAFSILIDENDNMNKFAEQAAKLFFQGNFLKEFMQQLELRKIALPDREYHLNYGVTQQIDYIIRQMREALVALSGTPQVDRESFLKNLLMKLDPNKKDVYEDLEELFNIFWRVEITCGDKFWKEFHACKGENYSTRAIREIAKKYPVIYI